MAVTIPLIAADGARSTVTINVPLATYKLGVQTVGTQTVGEGAPATGQLIVQGPYSLARVAVVQSLAIRTTAGGQIRLAIFDATGSGGTAKNRKAQTVAFTPVAGWNIQSVTSPATLSAGNYWLALHLGTPTPAVAFNFTGATNWVVSQAFSSGIPTVFPQGPEPLPSQVTRKISMYATLTR